MDLGDGDSDEQGMGLRLQVLGAVLAIAGELAQSLLVNGMDLLPDGTGYELWERSARRLWFTTAHGHDFRPHTGEDKGSCKRVLGATIRARLEVTST